MRDEGVMYVAGHPQLNRRCTRLPGCICLRNDRYCVGWGVLYSFNYSFKMCYRSRLVFICCFEDTDISQGSIVTHMRCGGFYSDGTISNFFPILTVKTVWKLVIVRRSYKAYKNVPIFWTTVYVYARVFVYTGCAVGDAVLRSSDSDQSGICRRAQQSRVDSQRRWQHPGSDHVVPNGFETETRFSRRFLQLGALPSGASFADFILFC